MDPLKEAKLKKVMANMATAESSGAKIREAAVLLNRMNEILSNTQNPEHKRTAAAVIGMGEVRNLAEELITHGSSLRRLCDLIEPDLETL